MPEKLQVVVDGVYVSALMPWGDLEYSTVWPGGSESLQFSAARSHRLFRPDAIVELYDGGTCRWCGSMLDPTRGEPLVAEGLHRRAEDYGALDASGSATTSSDVAVAQAILRGLPWSAPDPFAASGPALDPDQPHSVAQVLDHKALTLGGHEWGVNPATRIPYFAAWPTTPTFHLLPGVDGLAISRDGYASTLKARYLDSTSGLYDTVTGHDQAAEDRWGYAERMLPDVLAEGVAMTAVQAQAMVDGLIERGASQIGWATDITVEYGDVVNDHQEPIALHKITAGQMGMLHGLVEDVADLAGSTRTELYVYRVSHKGKSAVIEPRGLVSPMNDVTEGKR